MMKLRIRGDSLRLRLTQSEVQMLGRGDEVSERCRFPDGSSLVYALCGDEATAQVSASYSGGEVRVRLPAPLVSRWASSTQVSMEAEQPLAGGDALRILVEKDFACLQPREGEDDSDNYPHPDAD